ncbi:signal peptidase I [Sulfurisphaera ohwakuensis]|uniref:Signal peptidase n=1 Tax=Sulfurisphaera ohwakuensis TaxID=69656 RepID=A0A650CGS0_SULOH|nr:signal peptidase I [Sulfurisphaera ohwakuensis]MBB5252603.1 signal peptidase [Sulfurisphaera ohwakuensis]QGR16956.1 signal peptidase I [Sulfurisphaera ohwakuensis]
MKKSDILLLIVIILIYIVVLSGIVQTASVEGVSMYPIFQNGFLTFYTLPNNIKIGNIIIYKSPTFNTYVIHHVIKINYIDGEKFYVTKGVDNITNPQSDNKIGLEPPQGIPQSQVIGKVAEVNGIVISIPYLGYISILFSLL